MVRLWGYTALIVISFRSIRRDRPDHCGEAVISALAAASNGGEGDVVANEGSGELPVPAVELRNARRRASGSHGASRVHEPRSVSAAMSEDRYVRRESAHITRPRSSRAVSLVWLESGRPVSGGRTIELRAFWCQARRCHRSPPRAAGAVVPSGPKVPSSSRDARRVRESLRHRPGGGSPG